MFGTVYVRTSTGYKLTDFVPSYFTYILLISNSFYWIISCGKEPRILCLHRCKDICVYSRVPLSQPDQTWCFSSGNLLTDAVWHDYLRPPTESKWTPVRIVIWNGGSIRISLDKGTRRPPLNRCALFRSVGRRSVCIALKDASFILSRTECKQDHHLAMAATITTTTKYYINK